MLGTTTITMGFSFARTFYAQCANAKPLPVARQSIYSELYIDSVMVASDNDRECDFKREG